MDPNFEADLTLYSSIVITIVGILGNSSVLFIISQKEFRLVPMFRFLICSTIIDTITLFFIWTSVFGEFVNHDTENISCKLFSVFHYLFYNISTYIMVLCSIERAISLKKPHLKFFKNLKNQFLLILIIFVLLILANLPSYFFNEIISNSNETWCDYLDNNAKIGFYMGLYLSVISAFLPFLLMATCTAYVAHHLLTKRMLTPGRQNKKDRRFIKVILTLDLFFLISNLPFYTVSVIYDLLDIHFDLLYDLVNILSYTYSSFNFFVFLISNTRFRTKFIELIYCKKFFRYNK